MASEDSRNCDGLRRLIARCDRSDLAQAIHPEMDTLLHQSHRFSKAGEITSLCRSEWVLLEKRNECSSPSRSRRLTPKRHMSWR